VCVVVFPVFFDFVVFGWEAGKSLYLRVMMCKKT